MWLNSPDSQNPVPYCYKYKNIIHEALVLRKFSHKNPQKTREQLAEHFQITRNKVYILRRLLRNLPPEFIKSYQNCEDKKTLRYIGQEKLLKIAKLGSITKRRDKIRELLEKSHLP